MPNYDYHCITCEEDLIVNVPYAERDRSPCPTCDCLLERQMSMPAVMKASYPDGVKRKGWAELREASKLNKEAIGSKDSGHRKAIEKEIRDGLKVRITK